MKPAFDLLEENARLHRERRANMLGFTLLLVAVHLVVALAKNFGW